VIAYRATLDVPRELVQFTARLLAAERRRRGTPTGSRALTCFWEAVLALRWFRDHTSPAALARDHGISRATAYRYLDEFIEVLAAQAPDLHQALERAKDQGLSHIILDGKIIPCDRCKEPAISVKGQVIDLWYSGKAHTHGGNIQAVLAPGGFPLWISPVEPGSVHDITAARTHALPALYRAAATGLPTLADPGMTAPALASISRPNSPPAGGNSISAPVPATPSSGPCAAWANAGSPCSTSAGALSSTSPPALAKSATSPAPPSSSPISSTATSHEFR
jgi:DDE superfamily endonuclease